MGKWWKSKIFKGIVTGVVTTSVLIVSAGTATPVVIGSASIIGTTAGVKVANNQPSPTVGVKVTENSTSPSIGF